MDGDIYSLLLGTEDTVAGIAEARYDVRVFIESFVLGSDIDIYIRVSLSESFDSLWSSDEAHEGDLLGAFLLYEVDCCYC